MEIKLMGFPAILFAMGQMIRIAIVQHNEKIIL